MKHMRNPQPDIIKLNTVEMVNLIRYLYKCSDIFTVNDKHIDINICYTYHINELYTRLEHAIYKATNSINFYTDKEYRFKINHVEKRVCSLLFAMYPTESAQFLVTQEKIIAGLAKINYPNNQNLDTCRAAAMN